MAPQPLPTPESLAGPEPGRGAGVMSALKFRLAVLMHDRVVYRLAASLLGDAREAEDVTQEVFLSYWEHGHAVQKPREWLLKVTRNACLSRLRKAGRFVAKEADDLPEQTDSRDPAWQYEQHELAGELRKLVDTLPEPQRSLLVMFDVHGVDGATCGRVLNLNATQVKVYLHRARRRLRAQLERKA